MFITHVDAALEALVRNGLPLSAELGDVAFDPPDKEWSAQLSRITVNVFLYDVQRSPQPSRSAQRPPNGTDRARRPQPMIQLGYLISTWAGSARDEHQLLGDLASLLAGIDVLPPDLTSPELSSSVHVALGDELNSCREVWQAIGGPLRPAAQLRVTVAADTFDWEPLPPAVERIAAMAGRMPGPRR